MFFFLSYFPSPFLLFLNSFHHFFLFHFFVLSLSCIFILFLSFSFPFPLHLITTSNKSVLFSIITRFSLHKFPSATKTTPSTPYPFSFTSSPHRLHSWLDPPHINLFLIPYYRFSLPRVLLSELFFTWVSSVLMNSPQLASRGRRLSPSSRQNETFSSIWFICQSVRIRVCTRTRL